ncbi:DMT family transporter [Rhodoligotrophos defluvii]|uniref:DMT family transporter n=1 Tax=Rhodoligotrophos defluvii TaxID=2561934 RepID=UPI0010CA0385|nr:DMT family transporter [Rhodoligotrophos defluvii]
MITIERAQAAAPDHSLRTGAVFLLTGIFVFSLQDIIIKWISGDYPVYQIVFFRSIASLPLIAALVWVLDGPKGFTTTRPWSHLARASVMFVCYIAYYMALAALPMADAVSLFYTGPIFIAILSGPMLGEPVRPRQWAAITAGFIGVLIVANPDLHVINPAALFAILSALTYALSQIFARKLGTTESAATLTLYASAFYAVASGILALVIGDGWLAKYTPESLAFMSRPWIWPPALDLGLMLSLGLIATLGFYCLAKAYVVAQPKAVTPFEYTALIWATLWGYLFFHEVPAAWKVLGIALIGLAGVAVLLQSRSAKLGR